MSKGWKRESARHSLASRGIKTPSKSRRVPKQTLTAVYNPTPKPAGYLYKDRYYTREAGKAMADEMMKHVEWVECDDLLDSILHMDDGKKLHIWDTDEFPQPTDQKYDDWKDERMMDAKLLEDERIEEEKVKRYWENAYLPYE